MFLASLIAALGMRLNSAPIIIGAMLIAPLMGPLLGTAFGMVSRVERRELMRTTSLLAGSVVGVMAVGVLTEAFVPSSEIGIASEVLARTAPDLRDFLVALAAGAAGAYAAFQPKVSSSLPGVAVAVALVPPLVAAGITAGDGATSLAVGALTLFAANVVGIGIGAVITMVLMAVWSSVGIRLDGTRMAGSFVIIGLGALLLFVPLNAALADRVDEARAERDRRAEDDRRQAITEDITTEVEAWISASAQPRLEIAGVSFDTTASPADVAVVLLGDRISYIPRVDTLDAAVGQILNRDPTDLVIDLRLIAIGDQASTEFEELRDPSGDAQRREAFSGALFTWLQDTSDWFIESVETPEPGFIVARVAVAGEPPPISELQAIVDQQLDPPPDAFSIIIDELFRGG
jgi:uncharacterized hydrophobic protein (TIGR00271 family)